MLVTVRMTGAAAFVIFLDIFDFRFRAQISHKRIHRFAARLMTEKIAY
jgi:hypothetical protein